STRVSYTQAISPEPPIGVLLTSDEERGSLSGRALVEPEAEDSHAVLVLEPPASGGRVKTARKGTAIFNLETRGKAAHAGLEPEKGASAIVEMARQIELLHGLNQRTDGISINVGVVHGGTVSNVVPARAVAEVDVRFSTNDEAPRVEEIFAGLKPFDQRVQLVVTGEINRPPLERTEQVVGLYEHARSIA